MPLTFDSTKNLVKVTLSAGYDAAATSIVLLAGQGAELPATPFNATWWNAADFSDPADDPNVEVVRVVGVLVDTLTVIRAQEGTSATVKNVGAVYKLTAALTALMYVALTGALQSHETGIGTALTTAWAGTSAASSAISLANQAFVLAEAGTVIDPNAYTALTTAWVGTATANSALSAASAGTIEATQAIAMAAHGTDTANTAYSIAVAGTSAASSAIALGNKAFVLAEAGTATANLAITDIGTINAGGQLGISIDGGGAVITTGIKGYLRVPRAGTITGWQLLADQSGTIVLDVWKKSTFPPLVANSITGTDVPTLDNAQSGQNLAVTAWTTTGVAVGDFVAFSVRSAGTSVTRVNAAFPIIYS